MSLDRCDEIGNPEQTEHWRSVLPEFSVADAEDLTGVSNSIERVAAIRQHYVLAFKHLTGPRGMGRRDRDRADETLRLVRPDRTRAN